ncbi:urease accessory protein UreD [Lichenibacterium minor]|uniref:Urease accessory protein UreD n=1 Tax=Lichenibacterium minor TaxID=2316528 RepID=A0A4Q2U7W1_9HYPH|nr:urease accessory protein UreD [Lichenibacterium minor]RYC32492.1 urease accessory protein UreD [Lichenibacterium minor]
MTDASPSNRARGTLAAGFRRVGTRTEVVGPHEAGGYRLRLPRTHGGPCEAVIVNTGGGMAGGDRADFSFAAEAGAAVTLTTTAAEKVYRGAEAGGAEAETRVGVALAVGPGAALDWLPQETILFDGARLRRRLDVEVEEDADLLMAEMLVFGRLGMGERMGSGRVRDRWRVRRGGRLALAEDLDIGGDVAGLLDRPALGGGARACATVVWASRRAGDGLDAARAALDVADVAGGASAWNGLLVARALSPSPRALRTAIVDLLSGLRGRALPRLWA